MKHSELVFIMDRSGSMYGIASDMEGAMKKIIEEQKGKEENVLVTFVRFDNEPEEVFHEKDISEIDGFKLEPRGGTALHDTIGSTVNTFERRFNQKDEEDQPKRVLFVIVTDGGENSSREFSGPQVKEMVTKLERDHDWGFIYVGANQDSILTGGSIGISRGNALNYDATSKGVRSMSQNLTSYVSSYMDTGEATFEDSDA